MSVAKGLIQPPRHASSSKVAYSPPHALAGVALASRFGHDEYGCRCRKWRSVTNVCRAVFCGRVSLASRKRLASLSVCEADGLESASALTGHASCLTTQRATAVTCCKVSPPFERNQSC